MGLKHKEHIENTSDINLIETKDAGYLKQNV